jgi:hypothetical protein
MKKSDFVVEAGRTITAPKNQIDFKIEGLNKKIVHNHDI